MHLNSKITRWVTIVFFCLFVSLSPSFAFKRSFEPYLTLDPDSTRSDTSIQVLRFYIPDLHPELLIDRLKCLQKDIKLTYSKEVLNWIKFYTVRERGYTKRMLERSPFYFPIFEEALKKHNLPDELKYLSIVESALVPKAQSWAAAVGLWQFIPVTGKEYGLHQDWFIDERMDIYKSTDAACRYLKFLYNYFKDWHLALAAYNSGPGRVLWAVKKAGGKDQDFWKVYHFLPAETRSYVPAFIATCYAMNYADEHFIETDEKTKLKFIPSDTLLVSQFLNLEEFAKQLNISKEDLEMLNPHLKKNAIPAYKKNYPLRFPKEKRNYLDSNRVAILRSASVASKREMLYSAGNNTDASNTQGKVKQMHDVSYGQSLAQIANLYGVTVANIKVWNRMPNDFIYPEQKLAVWVKNTLTQTQNTSTLTVQKTVQTQNLSQKIHLVQPGDTLWEISKKYNNIPIEKIKQLNNITEKTPLLPGQKLKVG